MEREVGRRIITLADARASGLTRYFTGTPCKRQHVSERLVSTRGCDSCAKEHWESDSARVAKAKYYCDNAGAMKAKNAAYYAANRDVLCARSVARGASDPTGMKIKNAAYYAANTKIIMTQQALYKSANLAAIRAMTTQYYIANPDKFRAYRRNRRARKRLAEGTHTASDITSIRLRQKDRCVYCHTKLKGKGQVDHITALANGGSNWPRNLQILCAPCNLSKRAKHPVVFAQQKGFLL